MSHDSFNPFNLILLKMLMGDTHIAFGSTSESRFTVRLQALATWLLTPIPPSFAHRSPRTDAKSTKVVCECIVCEKETQNYPDIQAHYKSDTHHKRVLAAHAHQAAVASLLFTKKLLSDMDDDVFKAHLSKLILFDFGVPPTKNGTEDHPWYTIDSYKEALGNILSYAGNSVSCLSVASSTLNGDITTQIGELVGSVTVISLLRPFFLGGELKHSKTFLRSAYAQVASLQAQPDGNSSNSNIPVRTSYPHLVSVDAALHSINLFTISSNLSTAATRGTSSLSTPPPEQNSKMLLPQ
eukprot:GILI01019552.1.p1 GENE.GILI01019552.1~~GILI01019552.1.p1  ORF type:complete len:304 (+),score=10.08 GILI01019552.1:25-912(+)